MKWHRYEKLLISYLHGELADEDRRRLEQHLDRCATCRQELEAYQAVIDRAVRKAPPVPSVRATDEIRRAAEAAVRNAGQRAPRTLWGYRWYSARAGVVAAVCSVVLLAVVVILVARVGHSPSPPAFDPPVIAAQPPAPSRTGDETPVDTAGLPRERDTSVPPARAPMGIETILADLEADTFYMGRELALETAPALDRRMQSLENAVVTLCLEWE